MHLAQVVSLVRGYLGGHELGFGDPNVLFSADESNDPTYKSR